MSRCAGCGAAAEACECAESCWFCDDPAAWIRHTQFAGDHFFCDKHAREQEDFGEPDATGWHHEWSKITK